MKESKVHCERPEDELGGIIDGDKALRRRVQVAYTAAAETGGRIFSLCDADGHCAVSLLLSSGHVPFQLLPLGFHILCGLLRPWRCVCVVCLGVLIDFH